MLGTCETKLKKNGQKKLHNDYMLHYSGNEGTMRHGLAIIFDPIYENYIEDIEYINERIIATTLKIKGQRRNYIQTYAPQHRRPFQEKFTFYEQLQTTLDSCQHMQTKSSWAVSMATLESPKLGMYYRLF